MITVTNCGMNSVNQNNNPVFAHQQQLPQWLVNLFLLVTSKSGIDSAETKSDRNKKPNIIFILSDDHTTNAISAYGSIYEEIAPTPNIDRIAKEGAILKNTFASAKRK